MNHRGGNLHPLRRFQGFPTTERPSARAVRPLFICRAAVSGHCGQGPIRADRSRSVTFSPRFGGQVCPNGVAEERVAIMASRVAHYRGFHWSEEAEAWRPRFASPPSGSNAPDLLAKSK
jgi:hypothetical protein